MTDEEINEVVEKVHKTQAYADTYTIQGITDVVSTVVCKFYCKYADNTTDEQFSKICGECPISKYLT